ncbi:hypothetical protein K3495_g7366 [Podosphaera aphanis]|nr:hypothetical protein K3495_g7366 [Podosphaera aphanis]
MILFFIITLLVSLYCFPLNLKKITELNEKNKISRSRPLINSLEARAGPNQRLVEAFGIENSFTTTSPEFHREFVKRVKGILRGFSESQWQQHSTSISKLVGEKIYQHQHQHWQNPKSICLSPLVRNISFRLVMSMFFRDKSELNLVEDNLVEPITDKINSLWKLSKISDNVSKKEIQREKAKLFHNLSLIFGKQIFEGPENPLNIIIPAYETLWRVVYRCFLEVRFRFSPPQLLRARTRFEKFLATPNIETMKEGNCASPSVEAIVCEALRLYPPTRRIHRKKEVFGTIDVENQHRREEIWGMDALKFQPERWMQANFVVPEVYMPFGKASGEGYFECPAKKTVGPMMIAIIVASLINGIGHEYELAEDLGDQPLSGERDGLNDLRIFFTSR